MSINRELKPLLHVLRHEYKGIQGYTPTNIQGVHEIGPHLLAFSKKWKEEGCPPLLACTLDVERAFDTVNQDRCVCCLFEYLRLRCAAHDDFCSLHPYQVA